MKKAQNLTINTVIVAAILIGLAIILVFMISKQSITFSKGTSNCEANMGTCIASTTECIEKGGYQIGFDCPESRPVCCRLES